MRTADGVALSISQVEGNGGVTYYVRTTEPVVDVRGLA